VATIPTVVALSAIPAVDPQFTTAPNTVTSPSALTTKYPAPSGVAAMPVTGEGAGDEVEGGAASIRSSIRTEESSVNIC
jgi:hypothetical protein